MFLTGTKNPAPQSDRVVLDRSSIIRPFALSILAKARVARSHRVSERQRKRLLESISDDIRKCSDLLPHRASEAAHKKACKGGTNLFQEDWHTQTRFDPGRKKFLIEHFEPVAAIRDRCLKCKSATAMAELLRKHVKVVWVLREEDARLNELGHRSDRPDPAGAYRQAQIRILNRVPRPRSKTA